MHPAPQRAGPRTTFVHVNDGEEVGQVKATTPITLDKVRHLPVWVDPITAGRLLGMSRTVVYTLLETREFPAPAYRVGRQWRIPTAGLLSHLGLDPNTIGRAGCGCGARSDGNDEEEGR
ncbi:helix-turn-helix domain-containing protein [Nocardiopsis sp. EMB25]|uniref:helix-turn-helix domain-containing protein n=1 Tax=Nocardiopsis sp. EMB25 TaxID=2835867 RepID=UPI002283D2DC|nr:helix-turn-helix domain-containing protein [Nocardiopsis sp. EMB25]MCY9787092.1 helix-turn-helix domain-containing protein [Nocardiopsis sp. EMB25]